MGSRGNRYMQRRGKHRSMKIEEFLETGVFCGDSPQAI
jgi:hypothetical protein